MTKTEAMNQLKSLGTAQNRKVYARHGVDGKCFGVSYANLGKLVKKIKVDQQLAEQLWETGNHDARVLATKIADPSKMTMAKLDAWVKDVSNYVVSDAVATLAAAGPNAQKCWEKWTKSKQEFVAATGWHTLAAAAGSAELDDSYFEPLIERIERDIHQAKNRAKHSMNTALIAIGLCSASLEKKGLAAARRIGKVEVDHGETGCKTPDAAAYIKKAATRRNS